MDNKEDGNELKNENGIYHEKQRRQLCLLHALNNLLQGKVFAQSDLDQICERF